MRSTRPHPAIVQARETIALEQEHEDQKLRRVFRAIELAPTLHIARELLQGQLVPINRLDYEAVHRYGLNTQTCTLCGTSPNRVTINQFNHVAAKRAA